MNTNPLKAAALTGLFLYGASLDAHAGDRWWRVVEVPAVDIKVSKVDQRELDRVREAHGEPPPQRRRTSTAQKSHGFAVLYRSGSTFRCEVFVTNLKDAATVDHEIRHCNGWTH